MLATLAFVLGSIIGSFLNVVVIRHGAKPVSGRSACLSCAASIKWYDNVPIISWLFLRGRCRHCGSRISIQYPIVEALTGGIFAVLAVPLISTRLPLDAHDLVLLSLELALAGLLIAVAVYDARHTIIPDVWVWPFCALALIYALVTSFAPVWMTIFSGPAAALPLFMLWLVSKGRWMGLGDVKLALGFGFFFGPLYGIVSIFFGFVIGAIVSICVLLPLPYIRRALAGKGISGWRGTPMTFTMKSEVAFGPYLVAAFFFIWISLLYNIPIPLSIPLPV